ncbi:hypothetical protein Tco_0894726 [Tanacetum coccineum]|uniref:Helitron helicase-like domain-containing protein n=1 Tax=Tanacetum coccineum TaxID=301880 RepID=A0ABQ5CIV3_9ASTR
MTTLAKFMIIAGADNWKSRMEHYMENRENGRMILNSVQNGSLIWFTVTEEDDTTRTKKYEELSTTQKIQADCDCKATNIVLQVYRKLTRVNLKNIIGRVPTSDFD